MLGLIFITVIYILSLLGGLVRPFWGLVGFYAFVFLQPEWNWRWSIPIGFGFQKYIAISVFIGAALTGFSGNRFRGWFGIAIASLTAFLVICYVSAEQSVAPPQTALFMDIITKAIVMAFLTARFVDSPKKCVVLLWVIVICSGYNAFRINEEYFASGYCRYVQRSWGLKGDSNVYSVFTIPAIAASIALCVYSVQWWKRLLVALILTLQIHQIMLMESRGAMLGIALLLVTAVWLMPKNRYTVRGVVAAGLIGLALAGPPVVKEFTSTFDAAEDRDKSATSRLVLWQAGYEITRDNLLLGVGPYAVQVVIPTYAEEYSDKTMKAPHNLFLEVSAGCGLPALACYLIFFILPWWVCLRTFRRMRESAGNDELTPLFALAICIPGYFLASMFASGAMLESMYVLIAACSGSAIACGITERCLEERAAAISLDMLSKDSLVE